MPYGPQCLLDNDLYKFTMQQAVLECYPGATVEYRFTNRNLADKFSPLFLRQLRESLDNMANLTASSGQLDWFGKRCPFLKPHYLGHLSHYRFDPSQVTVWLDELEQLQVSIKGPWHSTILWEVPVLSLISELYFEFISTDWKNANWRDDQRSKARNKAQRLSDGGCHWADFGTRRRRNWETQALVVEEMKNYKGFLGSSNVWLAFLNDTKAIGTMAHEWIMGVSALEGLRHANRSALYKWNDVYKGNLGIALTDTFTTETFFKDFDAVLARLYDGIRQDSANPFKFIDKAETFYKSVHLDPKSKNSVFSDDLNVDKCLALQTAAEQRIRPSYGIGTHLTNDFDHGKALKIVIKLWSVDGIPVVKLSDDDGKAQGDRDAVRVARWTCLGTPLDEGQ